jgi:hypothetical protein
VHLSSLFLLTFMVYERFKHLHTFVVSSYGSERFVVRGFQQFASSVFHRLPNQQLKLTE